VSSLRGVCFASSARLTEFWRSGRGSNPRPPAWQAGLLTIWPPAPDFRHRVYLVAERTGLEPATPGVTGRYSNQLNYRSSKSLLVRERWGHNDVLTTQRWWVVQGGNL